MKLYSHTYFAKILLKEASQSSDPFFSMLVNRKTGEVLSKGGNQYTEGEPLLHSEMSAMINLTKAHPYIDRNDLTMYSTAEPCPMCACGMIYGGISRLCFGITRAELVKLGWIEFDIEADEIFKKAFPKSGGVQYSIDSMPDEFRTACVNLFKKYKEEHPSVLPIPPQPLQECLRIAKL